MLFEGLCVIQVVLGEGVYIIHVGCSNSFDVVVDFCCVDDKRVIFIDVEYVNVFMIDKVLSIKIVDCCIECFGEYIWYYSVFWFIFVIVLVWKVD